MPEPGEGGIGHSWFVLELTSEHVEPAPEPVAPDPGRAGGRDQIYGGGPWMREIEERVSGRVGLQREVELRPAKGSITARRHPVEEIRVPGTVSLYRAVQFSYTGSRTPAENWARLLREDEEILLSL